METLEELANEPFKVDSRLLRGLSILWRISMILRDNKISIGLIGYRRFLINNFACESRVYKLLTIGCDYAGTKICVGQNMHDRDDKTYDIPADRYAGLPAAALQIQPRELIPYLSPEDNKVIDEVVQHVLQQCSGHDCPWYMDIACILEQNGFENTVDSDKRRMTIRGTAARGFRDTIVTWDYFLDKNRLMKWSVTKMFGEGEFCDARSVSTPFDMFAMSRELLRLLS